MQVFQNINEMKAATGTAPDYYAKVLGYYLAGDGGGGDFYWDPTSIASDNGGTVIQAHGVIQGRWKRIFSGAVNVRWFGAKCDRYYTDDSAAIQAAVNAYDNVIIDSISLIKSTIVLKLASSFTGINKMDTGLYTTENIDLIHVPATNGVVKNMLLSIYQNTKFDNDHSFLRVIPTTTNSTAGQRMVLDNIYFSGSGTGTPVGTGITMEVNGSQTQQYNYIEFASITNISFGSLHTAISMINMGAILSGPQKNVNFINGNVIDNIIINTCKLGINIFTDGTLATQKNGQANIAHNYFTNIKIQYDQSGDFPGIILNGGTKNTFDVSHFDQLSTTPCMQFSETTEKNFVKGIDIFRPQVNHLYDNTLSTDSLIQAKGLFSVSQAVVTVADQYNVQSIERTDVGKYHVTFERPLLNLNYKICLSSNLINLEKKMNCSFIINDKTTTGFSIYGWIIVDDQNPVSYHDLGEVDFVIYT